MDPTPRAWNEVQFAPLAAPDPARPDFMFRDDSFFVVVQVSEAAMPVWLEYPPFMRGGFLDLLFLIPLWFVVMKMDDRHKVVTFRQPVRRPSVARVVNLEFCESQEEAEAQRIELLRAWRPGQAAGYSAIKPGARRQARRDR